MVGPNDKSYRPDIGTELNNEIVDENSKALYDTHLNEPDAEQPKCHKIVTATPRRHTGWCSHIGSNKSK